MTRLWYDASEPPAKPPVTEVVVIYAGGDTPHVWTEAEINAQVAPYRLPCWVRSDPGAASASADASAVLGWLRAHGAPPGCSVLLDLETAIAPGWVAGFGAAVRDAGYRVLPYGSRATLFGNPPLDGYVTAHPGATSIDANTVGTQFAYEGAYDLGWLLDTVPLWGAGMAVRMGFRISGLVADVLEWPRGGVLILGTDGAIYATTGDPGGPKAPYLGGAYDQPYFVGRTAAALLYYPAGPRPGVPNGMAEGYTIVATSGERYNYPAG